MKRLLIAVSIAVLLSGCGLGSGGRDASSMLPAPVLAMEPDLTEAGTTSTATTQQPPITAPAPPTDDRVGSERLLIEEIEEGWRASRRPYGLALEDVPVPDLTTVDPVRAVEEIYRFNAWVLEHAPRVPWASVLALADSSAYRNLRVLYETFEFSTLRYTSDDGFVATGVATVLSSDGRVPPAVAANVPDGGVFVVYETSSGPYESVASDGTVYKAYSPFDLQLVVGVAPTPSGWKLFWEEM